ncbi:hypothetical protein BKA69DRAFT_1045280 [Paraphysoderma sedebokerense]|nr:hypothetical protein BKA69DRAFT_1045280 [Paraphysoderma sedebokerense]
MPPLRLVDIAVNLTDPVFKGIYRGKQLHPNDFSEVLARSKAAGLEKIIITGTTLEESKEALDMAIESTQEGLELYSTVGCHPTRSKEFETVGDGNPDTYLNSLRKLALEGKAKGKVVAIGECGLDYDRLQFCPKEIQLKYFPLQIKLASETGLPMFLHNRNTGNDFIGIMQKHRSEFSTGVVHSFDGSIDEMKRLIDLDLYIGINGCSLKHPSNISVLKEIPLDRLLLETDAPWCDIRPTHSSFNFLSSSPSAPASLASLSSSTLKPAFSSESYPFPNYFFSSDSIVSKPERHKPQKMIKSRNEPCNVLKVLEIVANVKGVSIEEVADAAFRNSCDVFFRGAEVER